jgi:acetyltransferase
MLDDLRGRGARVPELSPDTRATLATLLPPLTFQRNPVDTGRPGPEMSQVFAAVANDPGVDMVAAYALHEPDAVDLVAAARDGRVPRVPIVFGLGGTGNDVTLARRALLEAGIAVATDPRGVAAGIGALLADATAQARRSKPAVAGQTPTGVRGPHDEHQAKQLLDRIGITTTARRMCTTRAQAHTALAEIRGPVAVKILDSTVLHKTEIGGVHLGVRTPADLDTALDRLDGIGAARYLVETMAPAGVDLVLGARRDPVFGPIVLLGLGGTTAEALADVSIRLAPLGAEDAAEMPLELGGHALLDGWRGGPVLDPAELARAGAALGDLLLANPDLEEVEINPLRLSESGLIALDAVVLTRHTSREASDAHPHQ